MQRAITTDPRPGSRFRLRVLELRRALPLRDARRMVVVVGQPRGPAARGLETTSRSELERVTTLSLRSVQCTPQKPRG